ncbi:MAG TPA: lysine--tRNA ligase [candidate division Zixibacteria bacterium]
MEETSEILQHRIDKLKKLKEKNINPYPYSFKRTHTSAEIIGNFEKLESEQAGIKTAGRIISLRLHGKSLFAHLKDGSGKIQIYVKSDEVGKDKFELFDLFDIGDFLGVSGKAFKTKTGEITIRVDDFTLLSKSMLPLPEKWHGLQDKELRYRQRYVDLIVNEEVKNVFIFRTNLIKAMRQFLDDLGFVEVETPILQPLYGGAFARPFVTHHNALDVDLYLRIADELYLKRLIVGGFEKVYEISKSFRNEGMDRNHNPEFTMLELYQAYADYNDIMELYENLLNYAAKQVLGTNQFEYDGNQIDLTPPFRRIPMLESIKEHTGADLTDKNEEEIRKIASGLNVKENLNRPKGKLIEAIFEMQVQPKLIQPTFVTDYPVEMSPLAKYHREKPGLTERFELFIGGCEMGNAFSELNDPQDQRERFKQQAELAKRGDDEAQVLDEDFIRALEYGMPPTGGLGFGVDRLVMILTNTRSIREVIFFPQMRPEE